MTAGPLGDRDIERYRADGYLVPDVRLPEHWMSRLRGAFERLRTGNPALTLDFVPSPHVPHYTPGVVDRAWLDLAAIPVVLDVLEQLIGPDFLMWGSSLFGKPARVGKETPWHQDGEYWPVRPLASCTVWIAIDPSTTENGCLRIIPGSHREQRLLAHRRDDHHALTLNQVIDDPGFDESHAVDVVLEPGQFSVHDVYMVHGSRANTSSRPRAGITYRHMPTTSHFDHALAGEMACTMGVTDMSRRPLYQMRGMDRCGRNDLAVGHDEAEAAFAAAEQTEGRR